MVVQIKPPWWFSLAFHTGPGEARGMEPVELNLLDPPSGFVILSRDEIERELTFIQK